MKAESVKGLAADIHEVIFRNNSIRPWGDLKYQKRLNRLFFLSIVEILGTLGLGSQATKNYVKDVQEKILDPLKNLYPLNDQCSAMAKELARASQSIARKYSKMAITNKIWWATSRLVLDELIKNPLDNDEEKFNEFLPILQKNLDTIGKLAEMPPKVINSQNIYNASMSSFY